MKKCNLEIDEMIKMTELEFMYGQQNMEGICVSCGEPTCSPVEPDARNYVCESCGENQVFGLGEALLEGLIDIVGEEDE